MPLSMLYIGRTPPEISIDMSLPREVVLLLDTEDQLHFTKAVFEKVKKLGLSRLYKTNQLFRIWIRKLMTYHSFRKDITAYLSVIRHSISRPIRF